MMNYLHIIIILALLLHINSFINKIPLIRVNSPSKTSITIDNERSKVRCDNMNTNVITASQVVHRTPQNTIAKKFLKILSKFVNPAVSGGLLSGGLHAITGPDHLAALIPSSVGRSGWNGVQIGAIWGLGHGLSAFLLGMCFFFLKGQFTGRFAVLEKLANLAESAVGFSLVAIGIIGLKENMDTEFFDSTIEGGIEETREATQSKNIGGSLRSNRAILANGMLHGFSWDGAPSIAPAVAMSTWSSAVTFLLSYSIGTMLAMSAAAGTLGELSMRVGKASNDPSLPHKLSMTSSMIAIIIGAYWLLQSLVFK